MLVGKDLGWDIANHHYYLPFAWMEGRVATDLYAAGPQSYQNPLGFLSFYFMVHWAWPSWLIGCALALTHALNLVFVERIARLLWADTPSREGWIFSAVLLTWLTPIFLFVLGSSTVDAIGSALVLASLVLMLSAREGRRARMGVLGAGVLLALAFAVKQSNAVFVLAAAVLLLWQWLCGRRSFSDLLLCALGVICGLLLGMGWYSWFMWSHFGNPVFPLYNNIFQSPFASSSVVVAGRFIADNFYDAFMRVWDIALMKRFVYYEGFAPDIRPLALVLFNALVLALVLVCFVLRRKLRASYNAIDIDLLLFMVVAYALWMLTSGNGRYALPVFLLCGLMLVRGMYLFLPASAAKILVMLLAFFQGVYLLTASDLRFTVEPWDAQPYYKVDAAPRLVDEPFLHLTLGVQTHASIIVSALHPGGALMNPIGQVSLPLDETVLGRAFAERLDAWQGRTRVIVPVFDVADAEARDKAREGIDSLLYRMQLQVDVDDCELFSISRSAADPASIFAWLHAKNAFVGKVGELGFLSCAVSERVASDLVMEASMARADRVFAVLERECPEIYSPPGFTSDRGLGDWRRFYANRDATAIVSEEHGVMMQSPRYPLDRYIGSVDDVLSGRGTFDCQRWDLVTPN
jgi:hypothetical protein